MGRATNKEDLQVQSKEEFQKLQDCLAKFSPEELLLPFTFSEKDGKESHWVRDKNIKDVLVHLYEWQHLLLKFVRDNQAGNHHGFLPDKYNWRTYGAMNLEFTQKNQTTTLEEARERLNESHHQLMDILSTFSNDELFKKNVFSWATGSTLGSYFISSMPSHYTWAVKKIRKQLRLLHAK